MKGLIKSITPPKGFKAATPTAEGDAGCDFESVDGKVVVQLKVGLHAFRDLHSAAISLAMEAARRPYIRRACLILLQPKAVLTSVTREWDAMMRGVLDRGVGKRLALIMVWSDSFHVSPAQDEVRRLGEAWYECLAGTATEGLAVPIPATERGTDEEPTARKLPSASLFDVGRVLLNAWLRGLGQMPIGEVMRHAGMTHPTVASALQTLEERGEIRRLSNRSVELVGFPRDTWTEMVAMSETLRRPRHFVDLTGKPTDLEHLAGKLEREFSKGIAFGGVVAARHWDRDFDLNGTPRLDLTVYLPDAFNFGVRLRRKVDPALQPRQGLRVGAVLVAHHLFRGENLFKPSQKGHLPYADPVETLLDLHEMRLYDQAEDMIRAMEEGRRVERR